MTEAYSRIHNYDQLTEAIARLTAEKKRYEGWRAPAKINANDFVQAALDGTPFPDLSDHNAAIEREAESVAKAKEMCRAAVKTLESQRKEAVRDNADLGFDYLREQLQENLAKVREAADALGNVRTIEDVVEVDTPATTAAWKSLGSLVADYDAIRQTQVRLYKDVVDMPHWKHVYAVGFFADSIDSMEMWQKRRFDAANHSRLQQHHHVEVRDYIEWLSSAGRTAAYPSAEAAFPAGVDKRQYLIWVATKANPWLPNAAQVMEVYDAANSALSPVDASGLTAQERGRDRFYELTGTTPRTEYTSSSGNVKPRKIKKDDLGTSYMKSIVL